MSTKAEEGPATTTITSPDDWKRCLDDVVTILLRSGVVLRQDSEVWEEEWVPNTEKALWPADLRTHLGELKGAAFERAAADLLRQAAVGSGDPVLQELCGLQSSAESTGTADASGLEGAAQNPVAIALAARLRMVTWHPDAVKKLPPRHNKDDIYGTAVADDLYGTAVAGHCFAVQTRHQENVSREYLANFWNECVDTLNELCTCGRVPLVAAATLAYVTDCLIALGDRPCCDGTSDLEVMEPRDELTKWIPALGECWACLCAHINTNVAEATKYVIAHEMSLPKVLSACSTNGARSSFVDTLAEHLGYKFEKKGSKDWLVSNPPWVKPVEVKDKNGKSKKVLHLPREFAPLNDDLIALADDSFFHLGDTVALGRLVHMLTYLQYQGWKTPSFPVPFDQYIPLNEDSAMRQPVIKLKRWQFISANRTLGIGDASGKVCLRDAHKDKAVRRWRCALLCMCGRSTYGVSDNTVITALVGSSRGLRVRWSDGSETAHCSFSDLAKVLFYNKVVPPPK